MLIALSLLSVTPAQAQAPDPAWTACRAAPTRACVLAEATRSARALSQETSRAEGFDTIVRALTEGQRLEEALALSHTLRQQSASLLVRIGLVAALAKAGRFAEADQTATAILNPGWRAVAELAVAQALAARSDIAGARAKAAFALQLAKGAGQPGDFALPRIATAMSQWGDADEAIELVRAIASPDWRLRGLVDIAKTLSVSHPNQALELLRDASKVASAQGNPVWTVYEMRDVAVVQAAAGGREEARATFERAADAARRFDDQGSRETFLEVVGIGLAEAGLTAEALDLVRSMGGDWPRVRIATAAGVVEAQAGRKVEAAAAFKLASHAAEEGRPAARPFLHAHIADAEVRAGLNERAQNSLDRMDRAAALVEGTHRAGAMAMAAMTRIRLNGGDAEAALALITEQGARDAALRTLVEEHLKAGRLDAARAAALRLSTPLDRGYPLSLVAIAQAKAGKVDDALASLDEMLAIHYRRVDALAAIAVALAN